MIVILMPVNFIISYSHMWWHLIDQLFGGQTANLIQLFLLVNEVGGPFWGLLNWDNDSQQLLLPDIILFVN